MFTSDLWDNVAVHFFNENEVPDDSVVKTSISGTLNVLYMTWGSCIRTMNGSNLGCVILQFKSYMYQKYPKGFSYTSWSNTFIPPHDLRSKELIKLQCKICVVLWFNIYHILRIRTCTMFRCFLDEWRLCLSNTSKTCTTYLWFHCCGIHGFCCTWISIVWTLNRRQSAFWNKGKTMASWTINYLKKNKCKCTCL